MGASVIFQLQDSTSFVPCSTLQWLAAQLSADWSHFVPAAITDAVCDESAC